MFHRKALDETSGEAIKILKMQFEEICIRRMDSCRTILLKTP